MIYTAGKSPTFPPPLVSLSMGDKKSTKAAILTYDLGGFAHDLVNSLRYIISSNWAKSFIAERLINLKWLPLFVETKF